MHLKIKFIFLFLFSLFLLSSCETQLSRSDDSNIQQKNTEGMLIPNMSGAEINYRKVYSVIQEETGASFKDILHLKEPKKIKGVIKKLEHLLQQKRINNNKELRYIVHGVLASTNIRLYAQTKNKKYLNQTIEQGETAISIFNDNPAYKVDLASGYRILVDAYFFKKDYEKAISLLQYLIEEYQNIGLGTHENWFASEQINSLHKLISSSNLKPKRKKEVINYISYIGEKYKNEVGITAQRELLEHNLSTGEVKKAKAISATINKNLGSLNNPEFVETTQKTVNQLMEQAADHGQQEKK